MAIFTLPQPWLKLLKLLMYGLVGVGCAYCVSSCSLNFGA